MHSNLYQHFLPAFTQHAMATAISYRDQTYTFLQLQQATAQIAHVFTHLGIGVGERVMLVMDKSPFGLLVYLACLQAGIILVPLNPAYTEEELRFFVGDAQPKLILCDLERYATLRSLCSDASASRVYAIDEHGQGDFMQLCATAPQHFTPAATTENSIAALSYTSGTTGKPKGAMLSHGALLANARALAHVWAITSADTILHVLPLYHVHGLFFACNPAFLIGARLHMLPKFAVQDVVAALPQATIFMGIPTFYTRLLADAAFDRAACTTIRVFISGSAPLARTTFAAFAARTGHTILERYGMTETGIIASNPLVGVRKANTVGLPLPGVDMRICAKPHEVGAIQIRGRHLFSGYWQRPEQTAAEFSADGYFNTGDLGCWDEEGYLMIIGREKDMIISGGMNVYPKELELTLDGLDGVAEAAVIGLPHPDLGEAVVAVVVTTPTTSLDEVAVIQHMKRHHAGFKVPKRVFFVAELPKNSMGKVQKNVLRSTYKDAL